MSWEDFHLNMLHYFKSLLTVYTTTRLVRIRSTFLAVVYIVVVTFMWFTFFLGWLHLDIKKAYQKSCPVRGVVSTKVKGFASTEHLSNIGSISNAALYRRTWDFIDLVSPPFGGEGQYTGITVATNFVITVNQTRGTCPEEEKGNTTACANDKDCQSKNGTWVASGHGIYTGKCAINARTCEISGWCPIENDQGSQLPFQGKRALLEDVENFTILIKNSVGFPGCGNHKGQNIRYKDEHCLSHCIHHPTTQPKCPIFKIGDIVKWSNENFSDVAVRGGVFKVEIIWICDFDFGRTIDECEPKYSFSRVDDKTFNTSKGWNFRYADYHEENRRTLHKVFGLQILVAAVGEGRKFDFFEAIISLGAMVGLFAVASLVCDFLFDILCLLNSFRCAAMRNYTQELRFGDDSASLSTKISPIDKIKNTEKYQNAGNANADNVDSTLIRSRSCILPDDSQTQPTQVETADI
ncbi:unnamed protein product [Orchesella dallaii]|uniref:ATP receptor n=1 Tax=Orchesella dallaii TaxID=48710 RepID=A0ABP1QAD5_9HEXA